VDYTATGAIWKAAAQSLIAGGPIRLLGRNASTVWVPPASDPLAISGLRNEQAMIEEFIEAGADYVALAKDDPTRTARLRALLDANAELNDMTMEVTSIFAQSSRGKIIAMLRWEVAVAVCVALLGVLLTAQVLRVGRELEREINSRRRAESDLRRSEAERVEAYRQSDQLKSALLSSVSHELRTPLTAIKSSMETLAAGHGALDHGVAFELLRGAVTEVDYLDRLVENLLDMSRIEACGLRPKREWHPLEELIEVAVRRLRHALRGRPLELDVPPSLPSLYVDGVQIQQVFVNLLDNAVKYSPADTPIHIAVRQTGDEIRVEMANEGDGIPADEMPLVFDRFYRIRSARTQSIPGTGLGLAVCKGIIESHGGRIWIQSGASRGTTVAFTLPLFAPPASFALDVPAKWNMA
jgi:two-component system sensor histidine kinase KdpD